MAQTVGDHLPERRRAWGVEKADRPVQHVGQLLGDGDRLHGGARHVLEQAEQVRLLLVGRAPGLEAVTVESPDEVGPAWDRALAADRPAVLDVRCDPDVPPVPTHATFEEAEATATAMLGGDENRWGVIREGLRTKVQEFLPHSSAE